MLSEKEIAELIDFASKAKNFEKLLDAGSTNPSDWKDLIANVDKACQIITLVSEDKLKMKNATGRGLILEACLGYLAQRNSDVAIKLLNLAVQVDPNIAAVNIVKKIPALTTAYKAILAKKEEDAREEKAFREQLFPKMQKLKAEDRKTSQEKSREYPFFTLNEEDVFMLNNIADIFNSAIQDGKFNIQLVDKDFVTQLLSNEPNFERLCTIMRFCEVNPNLTAETGNLEDIKENAKTIRNGVAQLIHSEAELFRDDAHQHPISDRLKKINKTMDKIGAALDVTVERHGTETPDAYELRRSSIRRQALLDAFPKFSAMESDDDHHDRGLLALSAGEFAAETLKAAASLSQSMSLSLSGQMPSATAAASDASDRKSGRDVSSTPKEGGSKRKFS